MERCETGIDAFVTKADLWDAFYKYCIKYSIPNPYTGKRDFRNKVIKIYPEGMKKIDNKSVRVWVGIKLQEEEDGHAIYVTTNSLNSLERSKSNKENKEKGKKRRERRAVKLEEFKKNVT